ncbi:MAG: serine hydrolase [Chitinophagaceae bacterium]|nr:serine hydrolase [Chitinophagaceae bacterium]
MKRLLIIFLLFIVTETNAQSLYFPPLLGNNWDTLSPASLGWCANRVDSLYTFLDQQNSKAFIVLKDGKIVLEKYFDSFTRDSVWYWASAGKTITSFLVGKAQEDGYLSIKDTSSKYLGIGWTNCTTAQENNISIRNQLSMTTGLDDGVPDNHCILDTCLNYLAPAGTRWAYHNAPYTLLEKVLTNATGQSINSYTQTALKNRTGISGAWLTVGYDNVFYSKPRSMARFGLLIQNNCAWGNDTLLHDTTYIHDMLNTSQALNYGYGYLWWLNGKGSYMVPTSQLVIPGSYAPAAPVDMYAAIGKNGQIISIVPSKGLVVVRMGEADQGEVPFLLCNSIWERLNYVMCNSTPNITYTFTGIGNWNSASNWSNNAIPPAVLPAGDQIVIYPFANGECVLNVAQTIPTSSSLFVVSNKKFRIAGSLTVQ